MTTDQILIQLIDALCERPQTAKSRLATIRDMLEQRSKHGYEINHEDEVACSAIVLATSTERKRIVALLEGMKVGFWANDTDSGFDSALDEAISKINESVCHTPSK
jgi:hypothetical protein